MTQPKKAASSVQKNREQYLDALSNLRDRLDDLRSMVKEMQDEYEDGLADNEVFTQKAFLHFDHAHRLLNKVDHDIWETLRLTKLVNFQRKRKRRGPS